MKNLKKLCYNDLVDLENACVDEYEVTLKKISELEDKDLSKKEKKEYKELKKYLKFLEKKLKKFDKEFEKRDEEEYEDILDETENNDDETNLKEEFEGIFQPEIQKEISEYGNLVDKKEEIEKELNSISKKIEDSNDKIDIQNLEEEYDKKDSELKDIINKMQEIKSNLNVDENNSNNIDEENNINKKTEEEINEEKQYEQNKKEYNELTNKIKKMKNPGYIKTLLISALEAGISTVLGVNVPALGIIAGGATVIHFIKRYRNICKYENIEVEVECLKEEIEEYEQQLKEKNKKKLNKINKKQKDDKPLTNSEKIEKLKNAKEEIIKESKQNGVYGLKKDQIIQDRVNIREINNFYKTNFNSSELNKEKVMVKKNVA